MNWNEFKRTDISVRKIIIRPIKPTNEAPAVDFPGDDFERFLVGLVTMIGASKKYAVMRNSNGVFRCICICCGADVDLPFFDIFTMRPSINGLPMWKVTRTAREFRRWDDGAKSMGGTFYEAYSKLGEVFSGASLGIAIKWQTQK